MQNNSGSTCVNNKMLEYDWLLTVFSKFLAQDNDFPAF